jgi:hypothetical protein
MFDLTVWSGLNNSGEMSCEFLEHDSELLSSIRGGEFLDQVKYCQLLYICASLSYYRHHEVESADAI